MKKKYKFLDEYCLSKPGAIKEYKEEWGATLYKVGGKIFALLGEDPTGRPIVNLKLPPADGDFLRRQFEDVFPARHMNKDHWSSFRLDGSAPSLVLSDMVDQSHAAVLAILTRRERAAITG